MTLPLDFINRTQALLGKEEFEKLAEALQHDAPVSIRINQTKTTTIPVAEPVAWSRTGYYLPERLSFTFDPFFHAGTYYVQEASSMFLEQAIRQYVTGPVKCLDLCAAPGGKSTHLASILPQGSLLVSNEVIRSRSHILAENITKWGNPNNVVTNNDPADFGELRHLFDLLITDVPCSGEGMFRKDPESIKEWSVANVELCATRQRRILHDCWDTLKPGGILIYSTCTYNTEENEENIRYISEELGAEVLPLLIPTEWQITGPLKYEVPVYRFFPHKTKGEGFFLAVLRKTEDNINEIRYRGKNKKEKSKPAPVIPSGVYQWLKEPDHFLLEFQGEKLFAFPKDFHDTYRLLEERLHLITAGIPLGEIKGKDIIPQHALAMSTSFNQDIFPTAELTWEEAIRFLKKEALILPDNIEKGYVLCTFKGYPLGFVKNLGNRANNLYPQEWRIRSGYLPDVIKLLL